MHIKTINLAAKLDVKLISSLAATVASGGTHHHLSPLCCVSEDVLGWQAMGNNGII